VVPGGPLACSGLDNLADDDGFVLFGADAGPFQGRPDGVGAQFAGG
jgi:hypothetical protein